MKATPCGKMRLFRTANTLLSVITLIFFSAGNVFALPAGQQVVNGQAAFNTQGANLTITNSPNAIINWQGFSINSNEAVRFIQQSSSSAVLNRVVGQDPSRILGLLQSNGRVFLINPNGILFGQGARIDVNGLVASTLNISNQDFLAGKYNFTAGAVAGSIQNQGTITTPTGGKVYLIAPDIENSGIINSPRGEVLLAAGHSVQLVDSLDPNIAVVVSAPENKAVNLGQIVAQSGKVGIYGGLISQKGIVNADSAVVGENGRIFFKASKDVALDAGSVTSANGPQGGEIKIQSESGTTLVSGTVTAVGNIPALSTGGGEGGGVGKGGDIQILGKQVGLIGNALVDTSGENGGGTILVGGDYQGKNPAVQNAEATYFGVDASIRADAAANGDGGKVILWGNGATRSYGSISARGGEQSGNGGFVETSGGYLDVRRAPDVWAPKGAAGLWLLDPENIDIADTAGSNISAGPTFQPLTPNLATILDRNILQTYLNSTGNAIVDTTSSGTTTPGNITVSNSVTWTTANSLTLNANNNISINAAITGTLGTLTLNAPGSISQAQPIMVNGLELLGGGAYTINNISNSIGTLAGSVGSLNLQNNGPLTIGTVNGNGGLSATGNVILTALTGSGSININEVLINTDTGIVTLNAGGTINATTGGIESKGAVWAATLNTTSVGGQTLDGGNEVSSFNATNTGSGAISLVNTAPGTVPANTLTVTGITQAAGQNISVNNTGNINITGTIGGGAVTNLTADGTISQSGAGIITTTGLVANSVGGITLNGNNILANFSGSITSGGGGETGGSIELKNVGAGVITIGNITNDTTGLLEADSGITINSIGGININGLISTASGGVSLVSSGPITAVSAVPKHVSGSYLSASAIGGIGSGSALITSVNKINAVNATLNNIEIDNTGVLTVTGLNNGGSGNVILQNTGAITTDTSAVTSTGGAVSITAKSPLTIGSGGISASGNISLAASPSIGGSDNLTINGPVASSNGNIILNAGGSIVVGSGGSLYAPFGTITLTDGSTGGSTGTGVDSTATDNTVNSLMTAMAKITSDENGDDEDERKKKAKESGNQTTDDKKTDDSGKQYCN